MNFDRNTVIGFVVLGLLFFAYFYFNSKEQQRFAVEKTQQDSVKRAQDSLRRLQEIPAQPSTAQTGTDTATTTVPYSNLTAGTENITWVETALLKIGFSNKGGQPKTVILKKFEGADSTPVKLASSSFDKLSYPIALDANKTATVDQLYFEGPQTAKNAAGDDVVTFTLKTPQGQQISHQYVVKPDNYMVDCNIIVNGATQLLGGNSLNLTWQNKAIQQQKDAKYERTQSKISYLADGDYDYEAAFKSGSQDIAAPVKWVGVKQQFFNTTLVAKNGFTAANLVWTTPENQDDKTITEMVANLKLPVTGNPATAQLSMYYGPTDYKIMKQYGNDMENMVDLGSGIFSFVKYINRWIVLPVFNWFSTFTSNFGIVILLLTLFIRLVISPLTYSSYLSSAKMKMLRPEIEQLRAKYGSDQQQMSMEQMKLFREAGVNPLGGCIPAVLQIPIFFALYSFFNSNVALRGQNFLWADDLSQYDSILNFGHIPLISAIYGTHVSLFTITAVVTSLLISIYSMSMTPDQNNPVLKYMPYFFPIILLFVFNKMPAGLTWYYTVSNLITLGLQFVIMNYIIDHDKILARIAENRKKPKSKSKWQEKMEQMQEQQKQMKDIQQRRK
ncbi:MAG: membrane protein insertase YidC [Flavisolibacter sp.]